jgi:hypothetical protein
LSLDLILKDVSDPILRENFFRIQQFIASNTFTANDFKFIEADVPKEASAYPVNHGLKYTPTDIIPLSAEGDFNYFFRTDMSDGKNVYINSDGPVRLRFLVGRINQVGRRALKDSQLPFVSPTEFASTLNTGSDGWAFIQDGAYNSTSPFLISAGARTKLPNNAAGTLTNYINAPANATTWWDKINYVFHPSKQGEFYTFKLNFQLVPSANNKNIVLETDIGTGNSPFSQSYALPKGAGLVNKFSIPIPMAIGQAAFNSGIVFYITCDCDASVYGINLTIVRDYHL